MIQQIGRYRIEDKLYEGARASVYKAYDSILNQNVALKIMADDIKWDSELKQNFYREAKAAAGLNHPNLVTLYDVGEEENTVFIAMEYLEGKNLEEIIQEQISIPLEQKLSIMAQVSEGLNHAHAGGIIHRDIKPRHIFVTETGLAKILDFGITGIPASSLPRLGDGLEASIYVSPEQIRGEKCDARSDLFSCGIVFCELLTYVHPFRDDSIQKTRNNILNQEPLFTERFPVAVPGLLPILKTCLEKEPDKRYANASEVALACRRLLDEMDLASQQRIKSIPPEAEINQPAIPSASGADQSSPEMGAQPQTSTPIAESLPPTEETEDDERLRKHGMMPDVKRLLAEECLDEAIDRMVAIMMELGPLPPLVQMIKKTRQKIEERNRSQVAQLFVSAKEAIEARQFPTAVDALNRILELQPDRADALEQRRMALAEIEAEKQRQAPKEEGKQGETVKPLPSAKEPMGNRAFSDAGAQARSAFASIPEHHKAPEPIKKADQTNKEQWGKQEVENSVAEAEEAFQRGDLTQCEIRVRRAMVIDPEDVRAKELLSRVEQARESKKREQIPILLQQGNDAMAAADFDRAGGFARRVLNLEAHNTDAQKLIADINQARSDQVKTKIESLLSLSRQSLSQGEYESAASLANAALICDASHLEAQSLIKEIDRAKRIHEKELENQQNESHQAGTVPRGDETVEVADAADRAYIPKAEKRGVNYRMLIWAGIGLVCVVMLAVGTYWMLHYRSESKKLAELDSQFSLAKSYLDQKKYGQAVNIAKKMLASAPDNSRVREILTEAQKREREAAAIESLMLEVQTLRGQGQLEESLQATQKVLDIDPNYAPAVEARTQIQGEMEAGIKAAQSSEEIQALLAKAGSLLAACRLTESKAEIDKIKNVQDKEIQRRLSRARALLNACRLNEANALIRKVRSANSNAPELDSLGKQLAATTSQFSIISKELNKWSQAMGTQSEIAELSRRAESLFQQAKYDDCQNVLVRLLELAPQNGSAQELRDLANKARDSKKAYEDTMAAKRYDAALKIVDRLEEVNPSDPDIVGYRRRAETRLQSANAMLTVYRLSEPASLTLDDKPIGTEGEVEKKAISVGHHKLVITNSKGQQKTQALELVDGQDLVYIYDASTLEFRPLAESDRNAIEARKQSEKGYNYVVQHTHGMLRGSCDGELLISALRVEYKPYQTKRHAFSHPALTLRLYTDGDKLQLVDISGKKELGTFKVGTAEMARKIAEVWNNLKKSAR